MSKRTAFSTWSSQHLWEICQSYDAFVHPRLWALAVLSSVASTMGLFSQFENPTFQDLILCIGLGAALLFMATAFWRGAWELPHLQTKRPLTLYAFVALLGFAAYAGVSITANLSATAGKSSLELSQGDMIDALENAGASAASYVDEMRVAYSGLSEQADTARALERAEINGRGPTGIPGRGSVSNSFAAAALKYTQAGLQIERTLAAAEARVDAFEKAVAALRSAQADPETKGAERGAQLKVLSGRAIREMRALLALDPARSIRAAATSLAVGVPMQSRAKASSRARIDEISATMRAYARGLELEADRIEALAPEVPTQETLSTAQQLLATMWRLPAWTALAFLLDLMGWICVGFRVALYDAYKSRKDEETRDPNEFVVTPEEFTRLERAIDRSMEAKSRIEAAQGKPKRGRRAGTRTSKARAPEKTTGPKKPARTKKAGGQSND